MMHPLRQIRTSPTPAERHCRVKRKEYGGTVSAICNDGIDVVFNAGNRQISTRTIESSKKFECGSQEGTCTCTSTCTCSESNPKLRKPKPRKRHSEAKNQESRFDVQGSSRFENQDARAVRYAYDLETRERNLRAKDEKLILDAEAS